MPGTRAEARRQSRSSSRVEKPSRISDRIAVKEDATGLSGCLAAWRAKASQSRGLVSFMTSSRRASR